MKYTFVIFSILFLKNLGIAQSEKFKIYTLEEARNISKDSVFGLTLHKRKLTQLPEEIYGYKNLKILDISKNRLKSIPMEINQFKQLEVFDAGKNRLTVCPIVICSIPS
ncbi:MAG: hypothetical protein ACSHXL_06350, partial [Bacteroidota bacterium]